LPRGRISGLLPRICAVARSSPGTRVTVHAYGAAEEAALRAAGFRLVRRVRKGKPSYAEDGRDAVLSLPAWSRAHRGLPRLRKHRALCSPSPPPRSPRAREKTARRT
jgi:hypothetical protein